MRVVLRIAAAVLLAGCGVAPQVQRDREPEPFSPPAGGLMVTADGEGSLTVLDNASRGRLYEISMPGAPRDLVSLRDGTDVLVSTQRAAGGKDALIRVNVRTKQEVARIVLDTSGSVARIALSPDGTRAAVITEASGEVLIVDLAQKSVARRLALTPETLRDIAWMPDGTLALAAGNALLRMREDGTSPSSTALAGPAVALVPSPDGKRIALAVAAPAQLALVSGETLRVFDLPEALGATGVAFSPNGGHVYITDGGRQGKDDGNTVYRLDPTITDPPARYRVGLRPRSATVDGAGVAWVVNEASGTVTVINPDGSFGFELPVGSAPVAVVTVSAT